MPDEPVKPGEEGKEQEPTPAGVPVEDVTKLVDGFREVVDEVKDLVATPAAPAATPEDKEARQKAAQEAYAAHRAKADELAGSGETAAAVEEMYQGFIALQQAAAEDPEKSPGTQAMIENARRASRMDNKDLYETYGKEIEAEMADKPLESRLDPRAWDTATQTVRAKHVDDILAAERKVWEEELDKKNRDGEFNVPVADGPGRAPGTPGSAASLTAEQRDMADKLGMAHDAYATAVANYDKAKVGIGSANILDDGPVKPGGF
jgi:hypothetical protein